MNDKETKELSKFLSLVLRHQPQLIAISLYENGWTSVNDLLEKLAAHGRTVDMEMLRHVVDTNSKKRFAFNEDESKIRASQGHSIEINLGYTASKPPDILYHGSSEKNAAAILAEGLRRQSRHHVHLSADTQTASAVGQRYGKPILFEVMAMEMFDIGYQFFISDNGVWLTDSVPPQYLKQKS